ncbi:MAG: DUF7146 domain-containing protein [Methylocella sp.]
MSSFASWVADARRGSVQAELARRGLWSPRMAGDNGVPCPGCGGRDRFAVNVRKNVWLCRASGEAGDAIALARHLDGTCFLAAVETVTGRPPPGRVSELTEQELQEISARAEHGHREAEAKRLATEISSAWFRERERRAAWNIWQESFPIRATAAEDYLALRGLDAPAGARLRYHPSLVYFNKPKAQGGRIVHEGPALVAAIEGPHGRFAGVHRTWIDLAKPKGRALIAHPSTGEILPAKKVRGSVKGGSILLVPGAVAADFPGDRRGAQRLFLGEGIETALAVYTALRWVAAPLLEGSEIRSTISLCNLAGRAAGRVRHPIETRIDCRGRVRPHFVADNEPLDDPAWPIIPIAGSVRELVLLGDSDSEPVFTGLAMERAAKRFARAYPRLRITLGVAAPGRDFCDMLTSPRDAEVTA